MDDKQAKSQATVMIKDEPLYGLSFFHRDFAESRKQLIGLLLLPLIYTSLLMWGCLSLYYGSLISNNTLSKLTVYAVDLDNDFLGQQIIAGITKSQSIPGSLNWQFDPAINQTVLSQETVLDERAWAVLESKSYLLQLTAKQLTKSNMLTVSHNATATLNHALTTGIPSYNPLSSTTLFFASARNQITANSKVVPGILAVINPLLTQAAITHTAQLLAANTANTSALNLANACPQCLAAPFALTQKDLVPFDNAIATGSTMVGMIFLLTFAFSVFNILRASGTVVGAKLRIRDSLIFRTLIALLAYFLISLWFTLLNLAFGVPMDRWRDGSQGQGFMCYWMLNFCTMASVGLPMESLFTVIGQKWSGYFLTFWIIVNVSAAFTSFELMPGFYLYGYGFPFYNSIEGARTIIFGTKSHLGQNFGVLLAWMAFGWLGIMVFTVGSMRKNARTRKHNVP